MQKRPAIIGLLSLVSAMTILAFSHLILPANIDECQGDITHQDHIFELRPFHCIGHSEGDSDTGWDHVHPWMTKEWYDKHGLEPPRDQISTDERI